MSESLAQILEKQIRKIDNFKTDSGTGTNRLALSSEERMARDYLKDTMKKLGMQIREDCVGNIFGCYKGMNPALPPVWTGSHIDTVKEAGMFDGVAGIVAGLEAVRLIAADGIRPRRSIFVNVYTCEESTVFGSGCIGSRALTGHLKEAELKQLKDFEGNSLYDLLVTGNLYHEDEKEYLFGNRYLHPKASIELHIEQGPWLEREQRTIGIVDHICAPSNLAVRLKGIQSHAGGTSMAERRDAFAALAEISVEFEKIIKNSKSAYSTGTIGYVKVIPNAVNVIPGQVEFTIDIRDCDRESKQSLTKQLISKMREIAKKRNIAIELEEKASDNPMSCDQRIEQMIEDSCDARNVPYMHMISGAYHDSMFLGELCPVAMIFVPSRDGISHSPLEWTDFGHLADGTYILRDVLLKLAME